MIVRVKASKDIKRLTDERNAAMQVSSGQTLTNMKWFYMFMRIQLIYFIIFTNSGIFVDYERTRHVSQGNGKASG